MSNNTIPQDEQFGMLPNAFIDSFFVDFPVTSGFITANNFSTAHNTHIVAPMQYQHVQTPYTSSRHVEFHHWRLQALDFRREAQRQVVPKFLLMSSADFMQPSNSSYGSDRVRFTTLGSPSSEQTHSTKRVRFGIGGGSTKRARLPEVIDLTDDTPPAKKARNESTKEAKKGVAMEAKQKKDPFINSTFEDRALIMAKISAKGKRQEDTRLGIFVPRTPTKTKVQSLSSLFFIFYFQQRSNADATKAKKEVAVKFLFPTVNENGEATVQENERIVGGIDITGITAVHIYPFHVYTMMQVEEHYQFFTPKTFVEAMLLEAHELVSIHFFILPHMLHLLLILFDIRAPLLSTHTQRASMTDNLPSQFTHPPPADLQAVSKSFSTTSGTDILTIIVSLMKSSPLEAATNLTVRHMLTVLHHTPYLSVYQTFFNLFDAAIKVANTVFKKYAKGGSCDQIKVMICKVLSGFIEYDIGCYWEGKRLAAAALAEDPSGSAENSGVADFRDEVYNSEVDEGLFVSDDSGSPRNFPRWRLW